MRRGIVDSGFWGASVGTLPIASEPDYDPVRKDIIDTFRQFGDLAAKHKLRLGIETEAPNTVAGYLAMSVKSTTRTCAPPSIPATPAATAKTPEFLIKNSPPPKAVSAITMC